jgi:uncharacterized protein YcaQ
MPDTLSIQQARRLALAAQGLTSAQLRDRGRPAGAAVLRGVLRRLGALQIDSINVVARSHELVLASRAGPHDPAAFERLIYRRRAGFEYWGHAASFLPIETYRLFLPRMARLAAQTRGWWADIRAKHAQLYQPIVDRIRAEGPLAASDFREQTGPRRGTWWDWAPAKHVLEDLFDRGVLMVHDRVRFERRYDLTERVLPPGIDLTAPSWHEAAMELTLLSARALGVATEADLADYFRLRGEHARPALQELVASGLLRQVAVEGWDRPAYMEPGTPVPRRAEHPPLLLSPFDPLVWRRERAERLFDFHYRIEVYTPKAKRQHGYYTMPLLAGGRLVGRVDPKHDRKAGVLLLRGLGVEPDVPTGEVVEAAAAAAWRLAAYLGAGDVVLGEGMPPALGTPLAAAAAEHRRPRTAPRSGEDPAAPASA